MVDEESEVGGEAPITVVQALALIEEEEAQDQQAQGQPVNANRSLLSRTSGMDRRHVARILSGQEVPMLPTAKRIADAMGISLDELYKQLKAQGRW